MLASSPGAKRPPILHQPRFAIGDPFLVTRDVSANRPAQTKTPAAAQVNQIGASQSSSSVNSAVADGGQLALPVISSLPEIRPTGSSTDPTVVAVKPIVHANSPSPTGVAATSGLPAVDARANTGSAIAGPGPAMAAPAGSETGGGEVQSPAGLAGPAPPPTAIAPLAAPLAAVAPEQAPPVLAAPGATGASPTVAVRPSEAVSSEAPVASTASSPERTDSSASAKQFSKLSQISWIGFGCGLIGLCGLGLWRRLEQRHFHELKLTVPERVDQDHAAPSKSAAA